MSVTAAGLWFSPGILVTSTNKTDCHNIAEILLKVALNPNPLLDGSFIYIINFFLSVFFKTCLGTPNFGGRNDAVQIQVSLY